MISIRRASLRDAALLTELAARTFRDSFGAQNTPGDMELHLATHYSLEKQTAELASRTIVSFLAEEDGAPIGYAQLREGPAPSCVSGTGAIELLRFYVAREWHGRGVSRPLMEAVVNEARERGKGRLWLGVWEENPRAIAFYKKCGFVDVGSQSFMLGTDRQQDRVMALEL